MHQMNVGLILAFLISVQAQCPWQIPNLLKWSSASTWPSLGRVPIDGDNVTIASNSQVLLDVNTTALNYLEIDGTLVFDAKTLTLKAHFVNVTGTLLIGNETCLFPSVKVATIILLGNDSSQVHFDTPFSISLLHINPHFM